VLLGAGWLYYATLMRPYGELPMIFAANLRPAHLVVAAGGLVGLFALLVAARSGTAGPLLRTWGPRALALLLFTGAAYAYFLRAPTGRLAWHDAMSLRTFAWYVPPAALAAVVLGYTLLCWRRFWRDPLLLVTIAVYAFFVFYKIRIWPEHFWMARRFVPVILPSAMLMLSALAWYDPWRRREPAPDAPRDREAAAPGCLRLVRLVLPAVFLLLVALALWRATTPILRHVEYAGLVGRLEDLARRFTGDDLVLVESRASGGPPSSPRRSRTSTTATSSCCTARRRRRGCWAGSSRGLARSTGTSTSSGWAAPTCVRDRSPPSPSAGSRLRSPSTSRCAMSTRPTSA
jgi:hypothetical protein